MAEKRTAKKAAKKTIAKKTSAAKAEAKKASTKKASTNQAAAKKTATPSRKRAAAQPAKKATNGVKRGAKTKDPEGGLTQAGREYFNKKEGSHLQPGVKGAADTPEKKKRKGSFLRRHFANPRGPMEKDGEPTRLALSAQAWGEPLPKTATAARKLAAKGSKLLDAYRQGKADTSS